MFGYTIPGRSEGMTRPPYDSIDRSSAHRPHIPSRCPHRRPTGCFERLPRDPGHGQCGDHGVACTADVAEYSGSGGQVPGGSGSFGTDQAVAAESDDDVATVSVG